MAVDGKCVPATGDAASSTSDGSMGMTAKKPVGSGCTTSDECDTGTCIPAADNLPGGLCTIINCSTDKPCPVGSTCYAVNTSLSICMPYCEAESDCRTSENYHCQPLYTSAINF